MSVPPELIAAYRAALYDIDVAPDSVLSFHVERPCPRLDGVLRDHGVTTAVLLTAYNPRSRRHSAAENTAAHRALLDVVARGGKDSLPSRGRDPDGHWPAEPGLLILGLSRDEGLALAHRFDQYAFVWIECGAPPALVFANLA